MIKETDNAYHSGVVRFLIYDNFYGFHSRFYIFLLLLFSGIYYNVMIPESKSRYKLACESVRHVAIWYQRGSI